MARAIPESPHASEQIDGVSGLRALVWSASMGCPPGGLALDVLGLARDACLYVPSCPSNSFQATLAIIRECPTLTALPDTVQFRNTSE